MSIEDNKMKFCKYCQQNKTLNDFNKNGTRKKDGTPILKPYCKDCRVTINKGLYEKRKERGYYIKKVDSDEPTENSN